MQNLKHKGEWPLALARQHLVATLKMILSSEEATSAQLPSDHALSFLIWFTSDHSLTPWTVTYSVPVLIMDLSGLPVLALSFLVSFASLHLHVSVWVTLPLKISHSQSLLLSSCTGHQNPNLLLHSSLRFDGNCPWWSSNFRDWNECQTSQWVQFQ